MFIVLVSINDIRFQNVMGISKHTERFTKARKRDFISIQTSATKGRLRRSPLCL